MISLLSGLFLDSVRYLCDLIAHVNDLATISGRFDGGKTEREQFRGTRDPS